MTASVLIYVLAPNEDALQQAKEDFAPYEWARPIIIPQTFWLENIMYVSWLMDHKDEWMDKDYVGTIAWSASKKQPKVHDIQKIADDALQSDADLVGLLSKKEPLIRTAEHYHPGFTICWLETWHAMGYHEDTMLLHPEIHAFYCNYWMARPTVMKHYCTFMAFMDLKLLVNPQLKKIVWTDSSYQKDVAKMTLEKKEELFGVSYYPQIVFVAERCICLFAAMHCNKAIMIP
jgi:hypothetical protein